MSPSLRATLVVLGLLGAPEVVGQEAVTALDRTLLKTHMRQDTTYVAIADVPVQAFAPTTIQCGKQSCTVRVEVSSQFFNVTSGNAVRLHVKADGAPFPVTGFEIDGGINRPVAHLTTVSSLKTDLSPGPHTISEPRLTSGEGPIRSSGAITIAPFMGLNFPSGDLSRGSNTGLTFGVQGTWGLGVLALLAEASYSNFTGKRANGVEYNDFGTIEFAAGARAGIPLAGLYAGGLAGYWLSYSSDIDEGWDELDVVPIVGIHLGPADVGVRYKGLLGDLDWFAVTAAVHFRLR
jgi:hypothetical protein